MGGGEGFRWASDLGIGFSQVAQDGIQFDLARVDPPYLAQFAAPAEKALEVTISVTVGAGDPALEALKAEERKKLRIQKPVVLYPTPNGGELDLWREEERALSGTVLMALTDEAYDWRDKWPLGRAPFTHRISDVVIRWGTRVPAGTEVVIELIRKVGRERSPHSKLVVYVEDGTLPAEPPDRLPERVELQPADLELRGSEDIQGNILAGFNKPHQEFLLVHFPDALEARPHQWLAALSSPPEGAPKAKPLITNTADATTFKDQFQKWQRALKEGNPEAGALKPDPTTCVNLGLTFAGLCRLHAQFEEHIPAEGDSGLAAFRQGPVVRAPNFGAAGSDAPDNWDFGEMKDGLAIHAIVTIAADEESGLKAVREEQERLAGDHKVRLIGEPYRGDRLTGALEGREHFGFREGISQPGVEGYSKPSRGNPPEDADHPGSPILDRKHFVFRGDDNGSPEWLVNGSMQVFERLEQDVRTWREEMNRVSGSYSIKEAIAPTLFAAKLIGRWPSGTPLAVAPIRDYRSTSTSGDNLFNYANDQDGERTPPCAHIRKQNPRTDDGDDTRRILRRGIPYGRPFPEDGKEDPVAERGLLFNAFMTDIAKQFEKQQETANAPAAQGPDALVGKPRADDAFEFPQVGVKKPSRFSLKAFVRIRGVVYAFAPSIPVLQILAKKDLSPDDLKKLGLEL
jgi:Dyp-type peroxidase family